MAYWAIPALPKISEAVSPPLREFIQQLAVAGEGTARRLYNCNGWVAHGYVDNLMNTGIRSVYWSIFLYYMRSRNNLIHSSNMSQGRIDVEHVCNVWGLACTASVGSAVAFIRCNSAGACAASGLPKYCEVFP
jgi:hypothetical protein